MTFDSAAKNLKVKRLDRGFIMDPEIVDVAIIGAGPYGLSLAVHLKAKAVAFRILGSPMQTWRSMPKCMYLKSLGFATNVYTPDNSSGFVAYSRDRGLESLEPCAIADFAQYGIWAQQRLLPELEKVDVTNLSRADGVFRLTL